MKIEFQYASHNFKPFKSNKGNKTLMDGWGNQGSCIARKILERNIDTTRNSIFFYKKDKGILYFKS